MRENILAVDFENKKLLKNTQQKSDKKTNKHYFNHTKVCDGNVTIFQTKKSGGVWQMRMRVEGHRKYFQKSLRTKDKTSAIEKANKAVYKRIGDKFVDANKLDDLIDAEMRRLKTDYVRTSKKKSIRTYTHKLLNKAKANIEAVGKGTFGKGIYQL